MSIDLRNNGIAVLNGTAVPEGDAVTIIVVGVARSGTSMVASTLDKLGVSLGDTSDRAVFEDVRLARALEEKDIKGAKSIIECNNAKNDIWAFKRPEAFDHLPQVLDLFRCPRMVVTFRDAASIARRNEISMHSDFLRLLRRSVERSVHLVEFLERIKVPTLVVSYEKAIVNPGVFLDNLIAFCGLKPNAEQYQAALSSIQNGPRAYLESSRVWYEGRFEGFVDGVAFGWVRRRPRNRICSIDILAEGRVLGSGAASLPPLDLVPSRVGAGVFRIAVSHDVTREIADRLEARVSGTNFILPKAQEFRFT